MQNIIFPMRHLNITQKYGGGTHKYGYPVDNAGKDAGIDGCWAPFDGVIKKVYPVGHTVWLESTSKVKFADGTVDYATVSFTHDNIVSDLKVGQKVKYGKTFYQEGTSGQATGNHVHIEIAKGKFTGTGWYQAKNGQWVINNAYKPEKAFLLKDVTVMNTGGLKWISYQAPKPAPKPTPKPAPAPSPIPTPPPAAPVPDPVDYGKENNALLKSILSIVQAIQALLAKIFK